VDKELAKLAPDLGLTKLLKCPRWDNREVTTGVENLAGDQHSVMKRSWFAGIYLGSECLQTRAHREPKRRNKIVWLIRKALGRMRRRWCVTVARVGNLIKTVVKASVIDIFSRSILQSSLKRIKRRLGRFIFTFFFFLVDHCSSDDITQPNVTATQKIMRSKGIT